MARQTLRQRLIARSVVGPEVRPGLGPCFLWVGRLSNQGYGQIDIGGKAAVVSRAAYNEFIGLLLPGQCALHHCDVPACWRPDHLYAGTHADNAIDCLNRGRHGRAKLTTDEVRALRLETGTFQEIASKYELSVSGAWLVFNRKTWAHVV